MCFNPAFKNNVLCTRGSVAMSDTQKLRPLRLFLLSLSCFAFIHDAYLLNTRLEHFRSTSFSKYVMFLFSECSAQVVLKVQSLIFTRFLNILTSFLLSMEAKNNIFS